MRPVERGIERSLFDLQDVFGNGFDGFGDGVAVGRTQQQRLKDRSPTFLQQLDAFAFFFVDILGKLPLSQ